MPAAAATNTDSVDWLFYGILGLSIFCFAGITIAVVYFAWRYRHRKGHSAELSSSHNDSLEITWTVIPSVICVVIFLLGWRGFIDLNTPPKHAYEVQVTAQKWKWTFKYPNGWVDTNLHVPVNEPVRLVMRSTDVLHSFWVPAFRIKLDVIPNRYTKLWFESPDPGVYRVYCAEYCGTEHSKMKTLVVVHPPGGFEKYMEEAEQAQLDMPPVALGEYMYTARGCNQCHSVDGSAKTGPTWKGIFGTTGQTSAGAITVDEDYIRESILDPNAKVRSGFNAVMPTFRGQLKDEHIDGLITYIKCLK
jgi:cytochrome c oxidase subunit 2